MIETRVVNMHKEKHDVYIGRGSIWGNPFILNKDGDRETVIKKYEKYIRQSPDLLIHLHELKGKRLGCFCKPKACHGDVLIKLIKEMNI